LVDDSVRSRTIAPPLGRSTSMVGFLSVKSTPLLMKSCLLAMSIGLVRIEFEVTSVVIHSISVHGFRVVVVVVVVVVDARVVFVTVPLLFGVVRTVLTRK